MSDFLVKMTDGDKTPIQPARDRFLTRPPAADDVNFSLSYPSNATLSVTYVIQPFGVEKTIDYSLSLTPTELRMGCLGDESLDEEVDIEALAEHIGSEVYEDLRSEIW